MVARGRRASRTTSSDAEDSATGSGAGRGLGRGRGAVQVKVRLQEAAAGPVAEEDHMDDETEPPRP